MNGSVKLFQIIQKNYQSIGIYPPEPGQNRAPTNSKNWIFLICVAQFSAFSAIYLLFYATSMFEYGMIFYSLISVSFCTSLYLFAIWQMEDMLKFKECCEGFIEKSKYKQCTMHIDFQ